MGYDGQLEQRPTRSRSGGRLRRDHPAIRLRRHDRGGESHRYSLSLDAWCANDDRRWTALAYGIDYYLELISNFTYALDQERGRPVRAVRPHDASTAAGSSTTLPAARPRRRATCWRRARGAPGRRRTRRAVPYRERERFDTIRKDDVRQTGYAGFLAMRAAVERLAAKHRRAARTTTSTSRSTATCRGQFRQTRAIRCGARSSRSCSALGRDRGVPERRARLPLATTRAAPRSRWTRTTAYARGHGEPDRSRQRRRDRRTNRLVSRISS